MDIPFVRYVGIRKGDKEYTSLAFCDNIKNHIGTIDASAQFTLAETESGYYLESLFPQYKGKIIPLLRSSSVKYKNPATKDIYAIATASQEVLEKFEKQFLKKGRASITVQVKVVDVDEVVTMVGEFTWFIQKLEE